MKELLQCRAMESVCRQRATFYPQESWKWLAEAEMWNHKAFECSRRPEASNVTTFMGTRPSATSLNSGNLYARSVGHETATSHLLLGGSAV
jgi:hypothetical protein